MKYSTQYLPKKSSVISRVSQGQGRQPAGSNVKVKHTLDQNWVSLERGVSNGHTRMKKSNFFPDLVVLSVEYNLFAYSSKRVALYKNYGGRFWKLDKNINFVENT